FSKRIQRVSTPQCKIVGSCLFFLRHYQLYRVFFRFKVSQLSAHVSKKLTSGGRSRWLPSLSMLVLWILVDCIFCKTNPVSCYFSCTSFSRRQSFGRANMRFRSAEGNWSSYSGSSRL